MCSAREKLGQKGKIAREMRRFTIETVVGGREGRRFRRRFCFWEGFWNLFCYASRAMGGKRFGGIVWGGFWRCRRCIPRTEAT